MHNNNNIFQKLIVSVVILIASFASSFGLLAQETLSDRQAKEVLEQAVAEYSDWSRVELNGKVRCPGLPVSPSVKIYMEKNVRVMMSARVPLMGEVARVEVDRDSVLLVNKFKRCYSRVPLEALGRYCAAGVGDLQSMILGRMIVLGKGQLSKKTFRCVDVLSDGEGALMVVPDAAYQPEGATYGYTLDSSSRIADMVVSFDSEDYFMSLEYTYEKKGWNISAQLMSPKRSLQASAEFSEPKWGGRQMEAFSDFAGYKRVSIREALKF